MNEYVIGFLAFPAAVVAAFLAYCACRWITYLAAKAAFVTWAIARPEWSQRKRSEFAALCYGADRGWLLVIGDLGFAVFAGNNHEKRREAAERLIEKREFKLSERWANRDPH